MKTSVSSGLSAVTARWNALAPRERLGLTFAGWVLGLGLLWWLTLSPALQMLHAAATQRVELDRQLQTMQGLQTEAKALIDIPKITTAEAMQALEASAKQSLGTAAQLTLVGDRVTVTLKRATPDALGQWLSLARVNAHALPTEAQLQRSVGTAGTDTLWEGSIVLRLP
jgi:general secretion pathway protein M